LYQKKRWRFYST